MDNKGTALTKELLQKARACKSVEEILALAKESGREITEEEAKGLFEKLNPANGELSDDELDNISGGGCGSSDKYIKDINGCCSECGTLLEIKMITVYHGKYVKEKHGYCSNCDKWTESPVIL